MGDRVVVLGRNPGRIRSDFEVALPHPRDRKTNRFIELVDYIYRVMTQPEVEHTLPTTHAVASRAGRAKYQMLPPARRGGISGPRVLLQRKWIGQAGVFDGL